MSDGDWFLHWRSLKMSLKSNARILSTNLTNSSLANFVSGFDAVVCCAAFLFEPSWFGSPMRKAIAPDSFASKLLLTYCIELKSPSACFWTSSLVKQSSTVLTAGGCCWSDISLEVLSIKVVAEWLSLSSKMMGRVLSSDFEPICWLNEVIWLYVRDSFEHCKST